MNKTDNRHYNRKDKRNLSLEMDLWISFINNNEKPVLLGIAEDNHHKNPTDWKTYKLYYNGNNTTNPFFITDEKDYFVNSPSIQIAKSRLRSYSFATKWKKL